MKMLVDGKEVKEIEFGEVEVGQTKVVTVTIVNDSTKKKELKWSCEGAKIVNAPETLESEQQVAIQLIWTPTIEYKKEFKTELKIVGKEVYGHKYT